MLGGWIAWAGIANGQAPDRLLVPQPAHLSAGEPSNVVLSWAGGTDSCLENGGFELGDLRGWSTTTGVPGGFKISDAFLDHAAPDEPGSYAGRYGLVAGGVAGRREVYQDVVIPPGGSSMVLSWADLFDNRALQFVRGRQEFRVELRNVDDQVRAVLYSTAPGDPLRTGWTLRSVRREVEAGPVRIAFVQEERLGPFEVHLDEVRLESGPVARVEFDVYLGEGTDVGALEKLGTTSDLGWKVEGLKPATTYSWRVAVRQDNEEWMGPVWQFSVAPRGQLAGFHWGPVESPQFPDEAFEVGIQPVDGKGHDWDGTLPTLRIGAVADAKRVPGVLIAEVIPSSDSRVRFVHAGWEPVDLSGWRVALYDSRLWPEPRVVFQLPAGVVANPGEWFELRQFGPSIGSYPVFYTGQDWRWTIEDNPTSLAAVVLLDTSNQVVDFVCVGSARRHLIKNPVPIPVEDWLGTPLEVARDVGASYQRVGYKDTQSPADWLVAPATTGSFHRELTLPFTGYGPGRVEAQTNSLAKLPEGGLIAEVRILEPDTGIRLWVEDTAGRLGISERFDVRREFGRLTVPPEVVEGQGALLGAGRLTLSKWAPDAGVVQLSSSPPGALLLPEQVIFDGVRREIEFDMWVLDNDRLDGSREITVTAELAEFDPATGRVRVHDNETAVLSWTLPATLAEGDDVTAWIVVSQPVDQDVPVELSSSDPRVRFDPAVPLLQAGATQTQVRLWVEEDGWITGAQPAVVMATVVNWTAATATVTIEDGTGRDLELQLPDRVIEGEGLRPGAGAVRLRGRVATDLEVELSSSSTSSLLVPARVVVRAGQRMASWDLEIPDNSQHDGSRVVTVAAQAPGFALAAAVVMVLDDDVHAFQFGPLASPQFVGIPCQVELKALAVDGAVVESFRGVVSFTAVGAAGSVPLVPVESGHFTRGRWTGSLTFEGDGVGVTVEAREPIGAVGLSLLINVFPKPYRSIELAAMDMIYDRTRERFYASVGSDAPLHANRIAVIEPGSGIVERTILAGDLGPAASYLASRNGRMALSSNGRYLYVAADFASRIRRIDLLSDVVDQEFGLGSIFGQALRAWDLAVFTAWPESLAVTRSRPTSSLPIELAVFHQGVAAPQIVMPSPTSITAGAGWGELFGHCGGAGQLVRYIASHTGLQAADSAGVIPGLGVEIREAGDVIFTASGQALDVGSLGLLGAYPVRGRVEQYPGQASVAPDSEQRRVYFVSYRNVPESAQWVQAFDWETFLPLKSLSVPTVFTSANRLQRWGAGGLAFHTHDRVYFVESSVLLAGPATSDLAVQFETSAPRPLVGDELRWTITVTNRGPALATDVELRGVLPVELELLDVEMESGRHRLETQHWEALLGNVQPGGSAVAVLVVRPKSGGWMTTRFAVVANEKDPAMSDNQLLSQLYVGGYPGADQVSELAMPVRDLAWDPVRELLWVSLPGSGGEQQHGLVTLNPSTGFWEHSLALSGGADRLAMADDGSRLYVTVQSNRMVQPIDLNRMEPETPFALVAGPFGAGAVQDMAVMPGSAYALAVAQSGTPRFVVYDDGVARPRMAEEPYLHTGGVVRFGSDPGRLFVQHRMGPGFASFLVDDSGLQLDEAAVFPHPFSWQPNDFEVIEGLVYATAGVVLDPRTGLILDQLKGLTPGAVLAADRESDRLFYLTDSSAGWVVRAVDRPSLVPLAVLPLSGIRGAPLRMVRWGRDGLAFGTSAGQVFLLRSALVQSDSEADLVVTQTSDEEERLEAGKRIRIGIRLENRGPDTARSVGARIRVPEPLEFVGAETTQGFLEASAENLIYAAGDLAPGEQALLTLEWLMRRPGLVSHQVSAASLARETERADNEHTLVFRVQSPSNHRVLEQECTSLVYSSRVQRLFAAVPADSGGATESVVALDPVTGQIEPAGFGTGEVTRLALSTCERFLFALFATEGQVARLDLDEGQLRWMVPDGIAGEQLDLKDFAVVAGDPDWIVVATGNHPVEGSAGGVFVVGPAGIKPQGTRLWSSLVASTTQRVVYGAGSPLLPERIAILAVDELGVHEQALRWFQDPLTQFHGDRLFNEQGRVLDADTLGLLGWLASSTIAPDPASGRIITLLGVNEQTWNLLAYDWQTLTWLEIEPVPYVQGTPSHLTRWGDRGLAFWTTSGHIHCFETELLPGHPEADLVLAGEVEPAAALVGSSRAARLVLSNAGAHPAEDVIVTVRIPAGIWLQSSSVSTGAPKITQDSWTWRIAHMPAGSVSTADLALVTEGLGAPVLTAHAVSRAQDPNYANNVLHLPVTTHSLGIPDEEETVAIGIIDGAYSPCSRRLYLSLRGPDYMPGSEIAELDPAHGATERRIRVGPGVGRLALSESSGRLWVVLTHPFTGHVTVQVVELESWQLGAQFDVGQDFVIEDILAVEGADERLILAKRLSYDHSQAVIIASYRNGERQPGTIEGLAGKVILRGARDGTQLYALTLGGFYRLNLGLDGLHATGMNVDPASSWHEGFDYSGEHLFTTGGRVIDLATETVVGTLGGEPMEGNRTTIRADGERGRVYVLTPGSLRVFDMATDERLGQHEMGWMSFPPERLLRWGVDGLAFWTDSFLYLLRSSLIPVDEHSDYDGDGLPDAWERDYGFNPNRPGEAHLDSDGDGLTNLEEFIAGSNPLDPDDVWKAQTIVWDPPQVVIVYESVVGREYRLERSLGLSPSEWVSTGAEQTGTGGMQMLSDVPPEVDIPVLYRVVVTWATR
jgi:uncharacterized repeat protein (TIGR01451 family)